MSDVKEAAKLLGNISLDEEITDGWEKWVCEPIVKYPFAPRYAKAILIIVGVAIQKGYNIHTIVKTLIRRFK